MVCWVVIYDWLSASHIWARRSGDYYLALLSRCSIEPLAPLNDVLPYYSRQYFKS